MDSIHVANFPDDAEAQSGGMPPPDGVDDRLNGSSNDAGAPEPLQLPPSTYSLLFTQPVRSLPFVFSMGIVALSYSCLFLTYWDNFALANGDRDYIFIILSPNFPVNVSSPVRWAQYLSILIGLLMEEEIPTGLYLLRMIPRKSFEQQFPDLKYSRFILSSSLRVAMGYFFLYNTFIVLVQATEVLEIFYNVLAIQFIQRLDDIAFNLAKKDVFGKEMQRACTAKCYQTEFERQKFGRSQKLSIFLKTIYFLNLGFLIGGMAFISARQISGHYQSDSITVEFGNVVWEDALVKMPSEFHKEWLRLHPYFDGDITPDEYEEWTLVFSYFNGIYKREPNNIRYGRPVFKEMNKVDNSGYKLTVPAEIFYCKEIRAWVFAHKFVHKSKATDEVGCNWLLRSEETEEYDLTNVETKWKVWNGVIGETEVSYVDNECGDATDCNLNGRCIDGECQCNKDDGVEFLGSHCEISLKDECQTIVGEGLNEVYSIIKYNSAGSPNGTLDALYQAYSRPYYTYVGGISDLAEGTDIRLQYTGSRWFGTPPFSFTDLNILSVEHELEILMESHAFWERAYDVTTSFVSEDTKKDTPVGVDFYFIGERGGQFGPFGALSPIQRYNQTGRGYFRCNGPIPSVESVPTASNRKLRLQKIFRGTNGSKAKIGTSE